MTPITPESIAQLNASNADVVLLLKRETSDAGRSYYANATALRNLIDDERSPWSIYASSLKSIADFDFYIVTSPLPEPTPAIPPLPHSGPTQMAIEHTLISALVAANERQHTLINQLLLLHNATCPYLGVNPLNKRSFFMEL